MTLEVVALPYQNLTIPEDAKQPMFAVIRHRKELPELIAVFYGHSGKRRAELFVRATEGA